MRKQVNSFLICLILLLTFGCKLDSTVTGNPEAEAGSSMTGDGASDGADDIQPIISDEHAQFQADISAQVCEQLEQCVPENCDEQMTLGDIMKMSYQDSDYDGEVGDSICEEQLEGMQCQEFDYEDLTSDDFALLIKTELPGCQHIFE